MGAFSLIVVINLLNRCYEKETAFAATVDFSTVKDSLSE